MYNRDDWYWFVDGEIYSSAKGQNVDPDDDAYEAWIAAGNTARIIDEDDMILIRIEILESMVTPRRAREAILTAPGKTWLDNVNSQIAALRTQLT